MNNETVRKATGGQRNDVGATLALCIPVDLSFDDAQNILGRKTPFMDEVHAVFAKYSTEPIKKAMVDWQAFYREEFSMDCTFEGIEIPVQPAGFGRLIIIAPDITTEGVYRQCARRFSCWKCTDDSLNVAVPTNDRDNGRKGYAIWVRERVEADEKHKDKSADDLKEAGIKGMTLLERLVYELKFFKETGNHLDVDNVTLCSGSRYSDGDVPDVDWYDDELRVDWYFPDFADDALRAREVCS